MEVATIIEHSEGKLKSLTIQEKIRLINLVDSGKAVKDVAEENGVNRNTLFYILKNKDKIRHSLNANPAISSFKRIKQTKCPELEQRVLEYMYRSRDNNKKLSGSIIKTVALEIAAELLVENFGASNGWLFSFFKRHNITISDFNKGIDPYENDARYHRANTTVALTEEVHETDLCEPKHEEIETSGYAILDNSGTFEVEEMNEPEIEDPIWKSWCRMCGNCETQTEADVAHIEITRRLLMIETDEELSICEGCSFVLEDVCNMVNRSKVVENMFAEIQTREHYEKLSSKEFNEIRQEFGFEGDENGIEEVYLEEFQPKAEHEDYEEIFYDEMENSSIIEDPDMIPDETVEFDVTDETNLTQEVLDSSHVTKQSVDDASYHYQCHICLEIFDKMCFLSNHTRNEHQCLPKVACTCGRLLSTWDSLMAHRRKHSASLNTFNCDVCESKFRTKTGLSIHIKFKHDKNLNVICTICNRVFKDAAILKSHMRTHLPDDEKFLYECEICNKKMVNKWSLNYHIRTIHNGEKNHCCHICSRGFRCKSNLRSHIISHSTENVACEICGGIFKNRISLQSHRKVHKPEESRKFACSVCKKTFHNRNHLNRHMVAHSNERTFKCTFPNCTNEYKWQKDLRNHISTVHNGIRSHKCIFCDKTFNDSKSLAKHKTRDHSNEVEARDTQHGQKENLQTLYEENVDIIIEEHIE